MGGAGGPFAGEWDGGGGEIPEDDDILNGLARLVGVERIAASLAAAAWFAHLGQPLLEEEMDRAGDYLAALGFSGAAVSAVADWQAAAEAAESLGFDFPWWEAEEQLRAALTANALARIDESEFSLAMTRLARSAANALAGPAEEAAGLAGIADEGVVRAAVGAGILACHQRGLVEAAASGADHAFVHKFALFEAGRWPIAITGETFHLF